ncbi:MAG: glycoside hydrolase family 1 protein [Turneriella sp.]|nr:glycoside hydrolase family 1 protein [Turneriella sp.]
MHNTKFYFSALSLVIVAIGCGKARTHERISRPAINETIRFPQNFLWGTATASEQLEATEASDWAALIRESYKGEGVPVPNAGVRDLHHYPPEVVRNKTDHLRQYATDVALMKELGANAYRFSIAWDRLFPRAGMQAPDATAVAFYDKLFAELKKNGIQPVVTLFHFSSPAWFFEAKDGKRGWERDDAVEQFAQFVRFVVGRWGKEVTVWCTLNEPMVYIYSGYMQGILPPREKRPDEKSVVPVVEGLLRAHAESYRIIHQQNPKALVGVTQHTREFAPYRNYALLDRIIAATVDQAFIWDFVDAIQTGVLKVTNTDIEKPIANLKGTQDYLGINYYGRFYIKSNIFTPTKFEVKNHDENDPREIKNDLGWADYPLGMKNILLTAHKRYGLPIYVLESGTADKESDDVRRQRLLVGHLAEIAAAMAEGADVRGYFHWSLIDNFEWAEGFEPRFGLVEIDYRNRFARKKRKSFALYQQVIKNGISPELFKTVAAYYQ